MTEIVSPILTGDDLTDEEFTEIIELLRDKRQFDIGSYKDRCVRRRIAKRLRACRVSDVQAYLELLERDSDEMDTLLATLSIHVSQFFRNPDTFRVLEQHILPELCRINRDRGRRDIKLWSVGCAGGEEPYSLAMLMDELAPEDLEVHILGTDVSSGVLDDARRACYDPPRLKEVPAPVLQRYFHGDGERYCLDDRIRQSVEFQRQNIMADDLYPEADLILCRNVLIYFSRAEQTRILKRFAEALTQDGVLVLGRAETLVGDVRNYFKTEYPVERIYRRDVLKEMAPDTMTDRGSDL